MSGSNNQNLESADDAIIGGRENINRVPGTIVGGKLNIANSPYSLLIGRENVDNGGFSTVSGYRCINSKAYAAVFGVDNQSTSYGTGVFGANNLALADYTFVAGFNNQANRFASVCFGQLNTTGGDFAIAAGYGNAANGRASITAGWNNQTLDDYSGSFGFGNVAGGLGSFVFGRENTTTRDLSYALGISNSLNGELSFAAGSDNSLDGFGTLALGSQNIVSGYYGKSIGFNNTINGNHSAVIGLNSRLIGDESFSIGNHNINKGERTFTLGTFLRASALGAMVIGKGLSEKHQLFNPYENTLAIGFQSDRPTLFVSASQGIGTTGNVGISTNNPSYQLDVNGVTRSGVYLIYSDKKLKKDIHNIKLKEIKRLYELRPVNYKYKPDENKNLPKEKQYGHGFIPLLIAALQEKNQEIQDLYEYQKRQDRAIESLKEQMVTLKEEVAQICANGCNTIQHEPLQNPHFSSAVLYQNQPNPSDGNTIIPFSIPQDFQTASISIYNMQGIELDRLLISKGEYQKTINTSLPAGFYAYSLTVDNLIIDTKQMVITNK